MNRLVLGYDAVGQSFIDRLADRPGELMVLADDSGQAESVRETGIDARSVDITNVADIRTVAGEVDSIIVAPSGTELLREVVRTVRVGYPHAFVMACLDGTPSAAVRDAIEAHADRVVDFSAETSQAILDRSGDNGIRTRKLREVLGNIDGTLAVVTHDNPDPDAIGSAVGLARIAADVDVDAEACYFGEINHQENRALVNLFGFELRNLGAEADLSEFDAFALVDHSRAGVNDGLPEGTPIDIVVDHHPPREPIRARFVDLRSDVGSTSTLIASYLFQLGITPDAALASGLIYGIRTDTQGFKRGVSVADFEAAAGLIESADTDQLRRVESPSVSVETIETLGASIANRTVKEDVLTTCVGSISDRDTLSQAADRLLGMEGITTTLVFGYTEETVFVSARSRGVERDLGEVLREAFDQIGSAGGHATMAGAQISVGILTEETAPDERGEVIADVITERFFEALGLASTYPAAFVYSDVLEADSEFQP